MFLLTFLLYPFVEILVFLLVVRATSFPTALALTLATSFLGILVAKLQRRGPLFGASGPTTDSLKNYLFGNLGAFALILPGFVTDVLGVLILIPFTRKLLLALVRFCHIDLYGNANGTFSVFKTWSFDDNGRPRSYEQETNLREPIEYDAEYVDGEILDGEFIDVSPDDVKTLDVHTIEDSGVDDRFESNDDEDFGTIDVSFTPKE